MNTIQPNSILKLQSTNIYKKEEKSPSQLSPRTLGGQLRLSPNRLNINVTKNAGTPGPENRVRKGNGITGASVSHITSSAISGRLTL